MVDRNTGIANCGFDEETYDEVIEIVIDEAENDINELTGYYEAKDYENFIIKVHGLKSQSYNIGAMGIGDFAKELEFAGKEGRYADIDGKYSAFVEEYWKLIDYLK